jgi:hypothetical protein
VCVYRHESDSWRRGYPRSYSSDWCAGSRSQGALHRDLTASNGSVQSLRRVSGLAGQCVSSELNALFPANSSRLIGVYRPIPLSRLVRRFTPSSCHHPTSRRSMELSCRNTRPRLPVRWFHVIHDMSCQPACCVSRQQQVSCCDPRCSSVFYVRCLRRVRSSVSLPSDAENGGGIPSTFKVKVRVCNALISILHVSRYTTIITCPRSDRPSSCQAAPG